jgi:hypothetical protein
MSDELDVRIDTVGRLAAVPPPVDHINVALRVMTAKLAEQHGGRFAPQILHDLLHTSPSLVSVGLSTDRTGLVEVSGGGYARQRYAGTDVKFPAASGSWGTVEAIILFSDDTPLAAIPLARTAAVQAGDCLQVDLHLAFA